MTKLAKTRTGLFLLFTGLQLVIGYITFQKYRDSWVLTVLMLTPLLSVILTKWVTCEQWQWGYLRLKISHHWRDYLDAWLGVIGVAFLGALVYFWVYPSDFAPLASKFAQQHQLRTNGAYLSILATMLPLAVVFNPIAGLLFCFGEEVAWRGYLLPKLATRLSWFQAVGLSSFIWGLWHAPLVWVWLGMNYQRIHSLAAIGAQIGLCLVMGGILSVLFLKTQCIWVPTLALNAIDKFTPQTLFMEQNQPVNLLVGPNLIGWIGGLGLILWALGCYYYLWHLSRPVRLSR